MQPRNFLERTGLAPGDTAELRAPGGSRAGPRIVLAEDSVDVAELEMGVIRAGIKPVDLRYFQHRNRAWDELLRADPDLLITDLNNCSAPGRAEYAGMSGWDLLSRLAAWGVKYPILVVSGVLTEPDRLAYAQECAGPRLNVRFMAKPFAGEAFLATVQERLVLHL